MSGMSSIYCIYIFLLVAVFMHTIDVEGFQLRVHRYSTQRADATNLFFFDNTNNNNEPSTNQAEEEKSKTNGIFGELKCMMGNFDAVIDDFVYKRMGNGEQFYGKRKYNPSGNIDGDYNGMGQSDLIRIEIARVQKEEMELRKQRRLEAEQEARGNDTK